MRYLFCFVLAASLTSGHVANVQTFPSYADVVRAFFTRYNLRQYDEGVLLGFAKHKKGWYITEHNYNNYISAEVLFWSAATGEYQPLSRYRVRRDTESAEDAIRDFFQGSGEDPTSQSATYERHIYYGYSGWEKDVINDYGDKKDLSNRELEGLGRAYVMYASGFFFGEWKMRGFEKTTDISDPDRQPVRGDEPISPSRKDKFIRNITKALDAYEKIYKNDPAYKVKESIGSMRTMLANEHVYAWYNLCIAGYEKEAAGFLKPGLYPDTLLNKARGFLRDAGKNAILVTYGDNDTYPLWYVQQVEKYRTDVSVINYSLLSIRRYMCYLDKQYHNLLFSTPPLNYMDDKFDIARYGYANSCRQPESLQNFLWEMNLPNTNTQKFRSESYRIFSCRDIQVPLPVSNVYTPGKTGSIKFKLNEILISSDFLLLDILNTNLTTRPMYFTTRSFPPLFADTMVPSGMVYKLKPDAP